MQTIAELRAEVARANRKLFEAGLVVGNSGNVSGLDPMHGVLLIKPSGVDYEELTAEAMVVVDAVTGEPRPGSRLRPSVDLPHHLFLYRNLSEVRAVVHTHSNYATAFAALGKPIPCVLTALADRFGGEVPCAPYADNEGDHIGESIVGVAGAGPAALLARHGVFAWGESVAAALKTAIAVEDAAKTAYLASRLAGGLFELSPLPPEEIAKWRDRYQNRYGQ